MKKRHARNPIDRAMEKLVRSVREIDELVPLPAPPDLPKKVSTTTKSGLPVASLVIREAGKMSDHQRARVSAWLQDQSNKLVYAGPMYSKRFRATFRWSRSW